MKAGNTLTLVAGIVALGALATAGSGASAQPTGPEANRGTEASPQPPRARPLERPPAPRQPGERAPSEDGPSAQDEPPVPGCQDQGRKLELIV